MDIIYIDESHFGKINKSLHCWQPKKNTKFNDMGYTNYSDLIRENISLILACNKREIIYYEIVNKNTNTDTFYEFLQNLMKNVNNKKVYLCMDNHPIHTSAKIKDYIFNHNQKVLFGVEYYSNYNLCEYIFGDLKRIHYQRNSVNL